MNEPRTWNEFQKRYSAAERANHPDVVASRAALSARWAALKASGFAPVTPAAPVAPAAPVQQAQPAATQDPPDHNPAASPTRVDPLRTRIKFFGDDDNDRVLMEAGRNVGPPTADSWRGGWNLRGETVVLWVQFDQAARVAERRVLKTVHLPRTLWLDPMRWQGDVMDFETRAPMDWHLQRKLCTAGDGGHLFNEVRACIVDNEAWTYKLYLDYCDEEHVGMLSTRYKRDNIDNVVPEPLCWSILEDLVKAVLVMQQGAIEFPEAGWREIVHRDFKPDNVFLTSKRDSSYPKVQMSDFEHSFATSQDDPFNPRYWREDDAGHEGYHAPEMMAIAQRAAIIKGYPRLSLDLPDNLRPDLSADKILTAANVWNIGTTMFQIMNKREILDTFANFNPNADEKDEEDFRWKVRDVWWTNWDAGLDAVYSTALMQLVRNCLQDDPLSRPTPASLLASIRDVVDDDDECERKKNARTATEEDIAEHWNGAEEFEFKGSSNSYKIGMTFAAVVTQAG